MSDVVTGDHPAAADVCRALGFDPENVQWLDLHFAVGETAFVVVAQLIHADQARLLSAVMTKHRILAERTGEVLA